MMCFYAVFQDAPGMWFSAAIMAAGEVEALAMLQADPLCRGCRMPPFELVPFDMVDAAKATLLADVNPAQKGVFAVTPLNGPC
jgi:hypothetical protein